MVDPAGVGCEGAHTEQEGSGELEMELGGLEDWLQRDQMERRMGDSLLKWLGHDNPPAVRVSHKVWRKQLVDRTRQLNLGLTVGVPLSKFWPVIMMSK